MQCARGFGQSLVFTINLWKGDKVEFRNLVVSLAVRQINSYTSVVWTSHACAKALDIEGVPAA